MLAACLVTQAKQRIVTNCHRSSTSTLLTVFSKIPFFFYLRTERIKSGLPNAKAANLQPRGGWDTWKSLTYQSFAFIYIATSFTKDPQTNIMATCTSKTVKCRGRKVKSIEKCILYFILRVKFIEKVVSLDWVVILLIWPVKSVKIRSLLCT